MSPNQTQPPTCWGLCVVFGGRDLPALFTPQSLQGLGVITNRNPAKIRRAPSWKHNGKGLQKHEIPAEHAHKLAKITCCKSGRCLLFNLTLSVPLCGELNRRLYQQCAKRPHHVHIMLFIQQRMFWWRRGKEEPPRPSTLAASPPPPLVWIDKPAASLYMTWHELFRPQN